MLDRQPVTSAADLNSRVELLKPKITLPETEDSWETISKGIKSLSDLCQNGACEFTAELISILRSISRPLTSSMISERTRLSGVAFELTTAVAGGLGRSFDPLLPIFFPVLLSLCGRTNKVIITRARACITTIVEATQLPSILPYFLQSIKDKSMSIRLTAAEGTLTCMNCFNPPDLEKDNRARDIETVIRVTARDSQGDIRAVSRKLFEAYKLLLPNRVESFTAPLSPKMKKYLDIKATTVHPEPLITRSMTTSIAKSHLSSSTSAVSSMRGRTETSRPLTHTRSASSSALCSDQRTVTATATLPTARAPTRNKPGKTDMAPPLFVPVRPAQSSRVVSASRSTSAVESRTGVVSTQALRPAAAMGSAHPPVGLPTRPTSANSHREVPHRPQTLITNLPGTQELSSGPRRVPISDVQGSETNKQLKVDVARARVNSAAPRPTPADPKPRTNMPHVAPIREKAKPVPKVRDTRLPRPPSPGKTVKSGGLTQPTLSQLSRLKATAERKPPGAAAPKQPWGRPASKPTSREPTAAQKGNIKPSPGLEGKADRLTKPTQIPLPPSPIQSTADLPSSNTDGEPTSVSEIPAAPLLAPVTLPQDESGLPCVTKEAAGVPTEENVILPSPADHSTPVLIEVPPTPEAIDGDGASYCGVQNGGRLLVGDHLQTSDPTDEHLDSGDPTTPRALLLSDTMSESPTRTPISSLLSSIQRGFLFTPSSPLSPPQSYLARGPGMQDLPIPFPLNVDGSNVTQDPAQGKKPFMFGVGGDDYGRSTLGNVENLNVHK